MRIITAIIAATLMHGVAFPQEKPAETKLLDRDVFEAAIIPVKTLSGDSFRRLANLLSVFDAKYRFDDQMRTIVVYAPKSTVDKMRKVVEQLDRPGSEAAIGRNIEMTLTLLRCSLQSKQPGRELPPDMEAVAKQLRAATQYKDIQLWDVLPMRIQEGREADQNLRLPGAIKDVPSSAAATLQVKMRPESVIKKESGRWVRFDRMVLNFKIPVASGGAGFGNFQFTDVGLSTSGDFKEGQKTVIGKVSGTDLEEAIFVVVDLKVLE